MAMVEPSYTESLKFESVNGMGLLPLNENQQFQTLLIEAVSGASRSTALYYGGDLTTYVSESFVNCKRQIPNYIGRSLQLMSRFMRSTRMVKSSFTKMDIQMLGADSTMRA